MTTATRNWVTGISALARTRVDAPALFKTVDEPTPIEDVQLLRSIAAGDSAALGGFYDRHAGTLLAVALRILNDHKEAEDVLQEVFLQVWNKAADFDPAQGRPLGWAITMARHKAIDRLRSAQRRARLVEEAGQEMAPDPATLSPQAPETTPRGDEAELVRAALAHLPSEQRQAIEMAFFGGWSQTEIAAKLNEPLGTIKARIRRGMLKLREELKPCL